MSRRSVGVGAMAVGAGWMRAFHAVETSQGGDAHRRQDKDIQAELILGYLARSLVKRRQIQSGSSVILVNEVDESRSRHEENTARP